MLFRHLLKQKLSHFNIHLYSMKIKAMKKETIYILSGGRAAAINKKNGEIIWEVKLKDYIKTTLGNHIGQIVEENGKLFIGCAGILLCLSAKDGSLVWKNELKGWGYGFVSIANAGMNAAEANAIQSAAATAAITAAVAASSGANT